MILTNLAKSPELYKGTIKLIEESLGYNKSNSYDQDFFPLMDPLNHKDNHLLVEGRQIIGHIGAQKRSFGWEELETPAVLLGGIAIAKEYRGKGLFKDFFQNTLTKYNDKVSLFLLWSDLEGLYQKFDFYQAGGQVERGNNSFDNLNDPLFIKTRFDLLNSKDFKKVKSIYNQSIWKNYLTLKRDEKFWSSISQASSTDLYLYKKDNEILGYFCANKGQDLTGIVHEITAPTQIRLQIIERLKGYKVWLPEEEYTKGDRLNYTSFLKMGNTKLFSEFIHKWSGGIISITDSKNDEIIFQVDHTEYIVQKKDFYQYIFGPYPLEEFKDMGKPLYIPGLDSI